MSKFKKTIKGWVTRCIDPLTKRRENRLYPHVERNMAVILHGNWMKARILQRHGEADHSGMDTPYADLVKIFLEVANVSPGRRKDLKRILERNELGIRCAADLFQKNMLTERLLAGERANATWTRNYSIHSIQASVKQMSRELSEGERKILPYDPLSNWDLLDSKGVQRERKAFTPYELNGVFECVAFLDRVIGRRSMLAPYLAILLSGNRPSAVIECKKAQLQGNHLALASGHGNKRNGMAFLPGIFIAALQRTHKNALPTANLFLSSEGKCVDVNRLYREFRRAMALFYAREHAHKDFTPEDIAYILLNGKPYSSGGRDPVTPERIDARRQKNAAVLAEGQRLENGWINWVAGRDLYALKHTFATWCKALDMNNTALRLQMGHQPRDISDKHYEDKRFADVRKTTQTVFDVLIGRKKLPEIELTQEQPAVKVVNGGWVEVVGMELGDNTTSGAPSHAELLKKAEISKSGRIMAPLYIPPPEIIMQSNLEKLAEAGVIKRVDNRTRTGNLKNHNHAPGHINGANLSYKQRISEDLNSVSDQVQNPAIRADFSKNWQKNGKCNNVEAEPAAQEVNTPSHDNPLFYSTTPAPILDEPNYGGKNSPPLPPSNAGLKSEPSPKVVHPDIRVQCGTSELVRTLVMLGCRVVHADHCNIIGGTPFGDFTFERTAIDPIWVLKVPGSSEFPYSVEDFHKELTKFPEA